MPLARLGPTCSELSNAKNCNSKGVVDADGKCTCTTGYDGATCSTCTAATHVRDTINTAKCVPKDGVASCPTGEYSDGNGDCVLCPVGTFANTTGLRVGTTVYKDGKAVQDADKGGDKIIACTECPNNLLSNAGATSVSKCYPKFKESSTCDVMFGDTDLSAITTAAGCKEYADSNGTYMYSTTKAAPCADKETATTCANLANQCDDVVLGNRVADVCRKTCNNCGVTTPCVHVKATNEIRFFNRGTDQMDLGPSEYTHVCKSMPCNARYEFTRKAKFT